MVAHRSSRNCSHNGELAVRDGLLKIPRGEYPRREVVHPLGRVWLSRTASFLFALHCGNLVK
jgi:hypothetical protein